MMLCFSALQRAENSSIVDIELLLEPKDVFQCSSASRKFLNLNLFINSRAFRIKFQCSSASRKFLNSKEENTTTNARKFQCSSASRKFLNRGSPNTSGNANPVSVLFSEPKIPQFHDLARSMYVTPRFSALQRAENSSIGVAVGVGVLCKRFQCSSASRKFLNFSPQMLANMLLKCFSALQRAENSSMRAAAPARARVGYVSVLFSEPKIPQFWQRQRQRNVRYTFQCSSASRKFLNSVHVLREDFAQ